MNLFTKIISIVTILCFSTVAYATDCPNGLIKQGSTAVCDGYLISPEVAKELFQLSKETIPNMEKRYSLLEQELALDKSLVEEYKNQVSILKLDNKQLLETKDKIADDYRQSLQSQSWKAAVFVSIGVVGTILIVVAVGFAVKSFAQQQQLQITSTK